MTLIAHSPRHNAEKLNMIESEKTYFGGWWMWILGLILISSIALFALNSAGMVFGKKVERAVLVNSHQYIEGMNQRAATVKASIAEARARLEIETDPDARSGLTAQISVLNAQLRAITETNQ